MGIATKNIGVAHLKQNFQLYYAVPASHPTVPRIAQNYYQHRTVLSGGSTGWERKFRRQIPKYQVRHYAKFVWVHCDKFLHHLLFLQVTVNGMWKRNGRRGEKRRGDILDLIWYEYSFWLILTHSDSTDDIRKRVSHPETHKNKDVKTVKKKFSILQGLSPSKLLVFNGVERDQVGKGGVIKQWREQGKYCMWETKENGWNKRWRVWKEAETRGEWSV